MFRCRCVVYIVHIINHQNQDDPVMHCGNHLRDTSSHITIPRLECLRFPDARPKSEIQQKHCSFQFLRRSPLKRMVCDIVEADVAANIASSFSAGLIVEPIAFPVPKVNQSIMSRVPVMTGENVSEVKVIMETSTGNFYEIGRKLKETIFGEVIHAIRLQRGANGKLFRVIPLRQLAIKIYYRQRLRDFDRKTHENPNTEIAAMQFIGKHINIVEHFECCSDHDNVYSIMEFADGGELYDCIEQEGPLPEFRAKELFRQISQGLRHLHDAGVAHRDLTLENIICSQTGICKLIDFGMSLRLPRFPNDIVKDGRNRPVLLIPPQGTCGKLNYVAPEVMESTRDFNPQLSDVWSLGVILFILLTGVPPVAAAYDLDDRYRLICDDGLHLLLKQWGFFLSEDAVDLLFRLLRPNPQDRLTSREISEHPWLKSL